ncbi:hypothetical protein VE03_08154 [Pseudogymnoascus sp. 23342-1-I1]|nr:hypothetical protein VE03_08154 [Pseudogymnoascus sp. 23342-1-I1]
MDALPSVDFDGQQSIVRQILEKSRGCFLWVSIVVQELRNVHTSTDKQRILDEVPTDMNELYARILDTMSKATYGKELAKAILTWTLCSIRPLRVPELHEALQLDLKGVNRRPRKYYTVLLRAIGRLVEAGKALGTFLQEIPARGSSTSADVALLSSWATDLVRLVMQFGKNMEQYPGSIYHLIPPFCPPESALGKQFGSSARNITVRGLQAETWDDCLATVVDMLEKYSSIACSKTQFSVGCFSGKIFIFKQTTCQKIATLQHGEPVKILIFGKVKNLLVSAGSKSICIWDLESKTCDDIGESFFVGKEDGSVHAYDIDSGLHTGEPFHHARGISIYFLCFEAESQMLISVDSSSRTMIHKLIRRGHSLLVTQVLFDYRMHATVKQVVCQPGLQRILICSDESDMLWSISPDDNTILATANYEDREPRRWTNHPHNRDQLIVITHLKAHIHDWKTLQRLTFETGIELQGKIIPELSIQSITPCFNGTALATMFSKPNQPQSKSKLIVWNALDFTPGSTSAVPDPSYRDLSNSVEVLIGNTCTISGQSQRLIFLDINQ